MLNLQTVSILLELIIVFVSLGLAFAKKQVAGYGLALTFGIYVIYDASKFYNYNIDGKTLEIVFFIATLSALLSILLIYKRK
jgi:uncharacterized membrane protein